MLPRWQEVDDPETFVRRVLAVEADDIPGELIDAHRWRLHRGVSLPELSVDENMVAAHDADPIHVARRDSFVQAVGHGAALPPLIVLGASRFLVDGYARLRALRHLEITEATVLEQVGVEPQGPA